MTAHPLEQPALTRAGLLLARGDAAGAEAVLRQALALERPQAQVGPLGLSEPGWLRRWLQDAGVRLRS